MAEIEFRFKRSVQGTPAYWGPGYLTIPGPSGSVPSQRAALAWNPPGVAGAVVFSGAPDDPGDTRVWVVRMEHDPARTIIPIIDYGGSTPGGVAGGTNLGSTPSNVRVVWSPTGTAPAELFVGAGMPAGVLTHSGLLVDMPTWEAAPAGVSQEWTSQPAGTAINSFWGASGPWEPASGAQTITVQSASVVSGKEVTIPVWATVAGVVGTLTQPGAALQPILVDADGCVSPSAAKVELPAVGAGANVRRLPRWLIRDTGPLQWKLESTAAGVVSYAPFYVVPPLPPTPGPPIIVKLIPASGPDTGGTVVDVVGTDLGGATAVDFGGTVGTGLTVDPSGGLATVTTPAHTAGPAPVTITTPAGTSAAETFTFEAPLPPGPPTITKLIPTSGPDTGGTTVDIIGTDLTGATAVDFGGTAGIGLTVDPFGGLATVTSPAHTAGPAPVTITTPAGTSAAKTFTFEAPPVVTVPVILGTLPMSLCADAPDNQQVLIPVIYPITDVVSAEVGGVDAEVVGVLDIDANGIVVMGAPVLPPGTYDLVLTNSAGSSDPYPIEYLDCEGCPPDPTVAAVFPGAARPGATIQIVGTNLTDATVTMCGEPVSILSNDGTIITVVVPPGCPDGDTTITVTTPDGETTVEFTVLPPEPVPPADVSPRSWQIAQALLDAAFLCGAECARAFVTTDATPEGPPPGGCPCQLTATIVKDGYKTADGRRLVRSATIKLSLHQCTPIPQADEIPDPDTESDYALRQAETRDQMLRGLATARRQPSSVLGRCQTKQASEGWVHVSTTGGMSLYTMEVTVD